MFRHVEAYQSALSTAATWMSDVIKLGLLIRETKGDETDQLMSSMPETDGDIVDHLLSPLRPETQGDEADQLITFALLITGVTRWLFVDLVKILDEEVVTIENQGQICRVTKIQPKDPSYPIIRELRIYILPSLRLRLGIHGLWMGYIDEFGVVHLINSRPTADDREWASKELERLLRDPVNRARMGTMWLSFKGKKSNSKVRIHEGTKHSMTNSSEYRPMYYQNTLHLASRFIGGQKCLKKFLGKYRPGIQYDRREFALDMRKHFGASARIVCSNPGDPCLTEVGFVFDENLRLMDFPDQNSLEGKMIVRPV